MYRRQKRHPPNYKQQQANKSHNFHVRNHQHQHVRTAAVEYESSDNDVYVFQIGNKSNTHPVLINDTEINVIIDSDSTINILDENSFDSVMPQPKFENDQPKSIHINQNCHYNYKVSLVLPSLQTRHHYQQNFKLSKEIMGHY